MDEQERRRQFDQLLELVEDVGKELLADAAFVREFEPGKQDLSQIIAARGSTGRAMIEAVNRTRKRLEEGST